MKPLREKNRSTATYPESVQGLSRIKRLMLVIENRVGTLPGEKQKMLPVIDDDRQRRQAAQWLVERDTDRWRATAQPSRPQVRRVLVVSTCAIACARSDSEVPR